MYVTFQNFFHGSLKFAAGVGSYVAAGAVLKTISSSDAALLGCLPTAFGGLARCTFVDDYFEKSTADKICVFVCSCVVSLIGVGPFFLIKPDAVASFKDPYILYGMSIPFAVGFELAAELINANVRCCEHLSERNLKQLLTDNNLKIAEAVGKILPQSSENKRNPPEPLSHVERSDRKEPTANSQSHQSRSALDESPEQTQEGGSTGYIRLDVDPQDQTGT